MSTAIERPASRPVTAPQAGRLAVHRVSPADADRAIATITLAFATDPPTRWLMPEPARFLAGFPRFVRALGGGAFDAGSAHAVEGWQATALWMPPGAGPDDEALAQVVEQFTPEARRADALGVFESMGSLHPVEPHWYLPFIAADPDVQGRGLGSALLAHTLERCDAEGLPAYLEATSERSVPFYRRHGFGVVTVIRIGGCPPITPMWRPARPR
jgi:GNAT superfamily N-acetyltransferase